ncbi:6535_t:CDS:2, partial [Dentiscutata erythropus]
YTQVIEYSNFTYIEISSQANLTGNPPHVLAIKRCEYFNCSRNGSVIEINFNNTEEIQDINFCYVNGKNPINIYPLFDQYILVSYVHAKDTSDSITYIDRGMVIDWNGNIM